MNDPLLVSILINNYNYGRFLKEAIESALNQTYSHIEVIVVDDGSTDNSRETITDYGDSIKAILKENGGQASAFNAGFSASHGEIICFLDADDLFEPKKMHDIIKDFQGHPEAGWLFHSLEFFGNDPKSSIDENLSRFSGLYDLRSSIRKGKLKGSLPFSLSTATSGMCFRRSLLEKILPMPESIRITSDDYLKYVALGISPGLIDFRKLAKQRIHGNNAYTFRPQTGNLRAGVQILTAHGIKNNFSELSNFADNLMAMGIALSWWNNNIEDEYQKLIKDYISNHLKAIKIYMKAFYYRYISYRLQG